MRREKGFTLIEMLIVVAIIALIAAIAVPSLRKARQAGHAASATSSLRTMVTAQQLYYHGHSVYGTLAQLVPEGTLDTHLGSGSKSQYSFVVTLGPGAATWSCTATPEEEPSVSRHFYVDETGIIRANGGAPADATSPPIPE